MVESFLKSYVVVNNSLDSKSIVFLTDSRLSMHVGVCLLLNELEHHHLWQKPKRLRRHTSIRSTLVRTYAHPVV